VPPLPAGHGLRRVTAHAPVAPDPAQDLVAGVLEKAGQGLRVTEEEALRLLEGADLLDLSVAATAARNRHNDPARVSFIIDRNVNYTDVCNVYCTFCAFYHKPGDPRGYVLTKEQLRQKAEETKALGGTGFLLQGGVNPDLPWDYYLDLVSYLSKDLGIWVHGFSPVEIQMMAKLSDQSLRKTIEDLRDAGLGSIPGGGAEVLVPRIRKKTAPVNGRPETGPERAVKDTMDLVVKGRTAFIIAHRLRTGQNANLIVVLERGRLVEHGTHDELLKRQGLYYYLSSQQLAMVG